MFEHIIVMGVSGCGKSTLAQAVASQLAWPMIEGDAFHPPHNLAKMAAGQALNDDDRAPWLQHLNAQLRATPRAVLACSALKAAYRSTLRTGLKEPLFVHCHGSFEALYARVRARMLGPNAHFMPASLLQSQFEALEMPNTAWEQGLRYLHVSIEADATTALAQVLQTVQNPASLL